MTSEKSIKTFCKICNKTLISVASFERHMLKSHGPDKIHDCVLCNQSFNFVEQLLNHIEEHKTDKSESFYECPFCEVTFEKPINLESHIEKKIGIQIILLNKKLKECLICGESFHQLAQLNEHRRKKHEKTHQCDKCKESFTRLEDLHSHMKLHNGEIVFHCLCKKKFTSTTHLCQHLRELHGEQIDSNFISLLEGELSNDNLKSVNEWNQYISFVNKESDFKNLEHNRNTERFPCPVEGCSLHFQKHLTLVVHCRRNHKEQVTESQLNEMKINGKNQLKCLLCKKKLLLQEMLVKHLKSTHNTVKPFSCFRCKIRFSKVQTLLDHVNYVHKNRQFKCFYCNISFQKQCTLTQHYKKHEGPSFVKCFICGIPYADQKTLERHQKTHTSKDKYHTCTICSDQCAHSSNKRKNLQVHTKSKLNKCNKCNKSFADIATWKKHQKTHSKNEFVCQTCGKKFLHRSNLIVHIRSHTNERPYECPHCSKKFLTFGHYSDHNKIHLGIRKFKCDFCDKTFLHSSSFAKHKKSVHLGIRPYKCKVCQKDFSQRGHLHEHILTHSDERSFSCDICKKTFRRSDALKNHFKKHKSNEMFNKIKKDGPVILNVQHFDPSIEYKDIIKSISNHIVMDN